jgi:hypothetical protein
VLEERVLGPTSAALLVLGVVLGSLGRGLPVAIADLTYQGRELPPCDDASVAACAVAAMPESIGQTFVFGLVVLFTAVMLAAGGSLLLALGFRTGQGAENASTLGIEPEQVSRIRPIRVFSITIGSALLMPVVWLIASFAHFVLTGR